MVMAEDAGESCGIKVDEATIGKHLSSLGLSPGHLAHVYTECSLSFLHIIDASALAHFPHLQTLDLSNNMLHSLAAGEHLPYLKRLNLSSNRFVDLFGYGPRALQELDMSSNSIKSIATVVHPFLRHLNLSNNQLTDIGALYNLQYLTLLDVSNNCIKDVSPVLHNPLEELYGSCNQIGSLDGWPPIKSLRTLDLSSNHLSSLQGIERCVSITDLSLRSNHIENIDEIRRLSPMQLLRQLDLGDNPIVHMSSPSYRLNVLFVLPGLETLDGEGASSEEFIRASELHGIYASHVEGLRGVLLPHGEMTTRQSLEMSTRKHRGIDDLPNLDGKSYWNTRCEANMIGAWEPFITLVDRMYDKNDDESCKQSTTIDLSNIPLGEIGLFAVAHTLEECAQEYVTSLVLCNTMHRDRYSSRLSNHYALSLLCDRIESKHSLIRQLDLSSCMLQHEDAKIIGRMLQKSSQLQSLILNDNDIAIPHAEMSSGEDVDEIIMHPCPGLESILTSITTNTHSSLRHLHLANNRIDTMDSCTIIAQFIDGPCQLERLVLASNAFPTSGAVKIIESIATNTSLDALDLSNCSLSSSYTYETLGKSLSKNNRLRELDISLNKIHHLDALARGLVKSKSLGHLKMRTCSITDWTPLTQMMKPIRLAFESDDQYNSKCVLNLQSFDCSDNATITTPFIIALPRSKLTHLVIPCDPRASQGIANLFMDPNCCINMIHIDKPLEGWSHIVGDADWTMLCQSIVCAKSLEHIRMDWHSDWLTDAQQEQFIQALVNVSCLSSIKIPLRRSHLVEQLIARNVHIESLHVESLIDTHGVGLALSHPNMSLRHLELSKCRLSGALLQALKIGISNNSSVHSLSIVDTRLGTYDEDSVSCLFESIASSTSIRKLDLRRCELNQLNYEDLATALTSGSGVLEELDLRGNIVSPDGFQSVCRILQCVVSLRCIAFPSATDLVMICAHSLQQTHRDVDTTLNSLQRIGQALSSNPTIQTIDLSELLSANLQPHHRRYINTILASIRVDDIRTCGTSEFHTAMDEGTDIEDNMYAAYLAYNRIRNIQHHYTSITTSNL